ncbi:MAG: pyridoxal phosphate-dependent aminotransferase [Candidatus Bathyarchaeia archaeon]
MIKMIEYLSERSRELRQSAFADFFAEAVEMERSGEDVIHLHVGEPDLPTPQHIVQAALKAMEEGYTHYTPPGGILELREAISEKLRRDNSLEIDPHREVTVLSGGYNALFCAFQALIDPGDEVIIPEPCLPQYWGDISLAGGRAVPVRLMEDEDFRPDLEDLASKINNKTKMILINSPQNPTGSILNLKDMRRIADLAEANDLLVLSDEVYEKFIYDGSEHISFASIEGMKERTLTVNSLSKTYAMTGWRVGYVAGDSVLIEKIRMVSEHAVWCPNSIAQKAAVAALRGPQECVRDMVNEFKERRDLITSGLNKIRNFKCNPPKGAFYVFPNIKGLGASSMELAQMILKRAKVAVIPGVAFGRAGEGNLRFSFANSKEHIREAMERIREVIC